MIPFIIQRQESEKRGPYPYRGVGLGLLALCFLLLLNGCEGCRKTPSEPEKPKGTFIPQSRGDKQKIMIDTASLWVEIAASEEKRSQGLMFRESLGEDEGMLFVFRYSHILSFWMKNTILPLDIAYVDEAGYITDILHMQPQAGSPLSDDELPLYPSSRPAIYAIETNHGWFEKRGIKAGMKVRFK